MSDTNLPVSETTLDEEPNAAAEISDMPELAERDLADLFGASGALAQTLPSYEFRSSQLEMAEAVKRSLLSHSHALIEAPTGTGKSIAYLAPAILSGKTVVVATANKALQTQLYEKDIPLLSRVLDRPIEAVLVKGRSNFICNYKWDKEAFEQQRFSYVDREHDQAAFLRDWLSETETGDVDDLPFMLDIDLKPRVVSYTDDCLQRDCAYFEDDCWINRMRDRASEAQVLITNHHLLLNALELGWAGERILPPATIYVIDEAHQLEQTATSVFETTVTDFTVEQALNRNVIRDYLDEDQADELRFHNTLAFQEISHLSRDNSFRIESELEEVKKLAHALHTLAKRIEADSPSSVKSDLDAEFEDNAAPSKVNDEEAERRRMIELALESLNSAATNLLTIASNRRDDQYVRYAVRVFDRRRVTLEVHAAPINPERLLSQVLFHPESSDDDESIDRTVICTSATLATNRNFTHFKTRCGIHEAGEEKVLPPVFDYPQQTLLYQPPLPAYDWRNAEVYYADVSNEIGRLLELSRGRALCLFTSWSGLRHVADRLCKEASPIIWPIRAQGDAPRGALLDWFKRTPHSVLLATRSFWEGVDIPGDDLSLVVLDKMPFPTPGDPLHGARMKALDDQGRSSFGDYMAPLMTLALKQGFGRLIRRTSDLGVVAILDERLTSKQYGRQARQDLPPARFSRILGDVHRFFQSALESQAEFGLNVWCEVEDGSARWRWQLLRLQDGKADQDKGILHGEAEPIAGERHAIETGLDNLRQRIEGAGREPSQFGVEIRCSAQTAAQLSHDTDNQSWKALDFIAIDEISEAVETEDEEGVLLF